MTTDDSTQITTQNGARIGLVLAADLQPEAQKPPKEVVAAGIAVWPAGSSIGWAVRTNDDRELSGIVRGRDERAGYLQAFERVVELSRDPGVVRVELFCSDRMFIDAVGPLASSWPSLTIHPWDESRERGWLVTRARTLAHQTVQPPVASVEVVEGFDETVPLLSATDGSKGAKGSSGFGWITAEGGFGYGHFSGCILLTELAAVEALLAGTARRRPLIVLMDSRDGLRVLHGLQRGEAVTAQRVPGTHASWSLLRRIERALRGRDVSFRWVRGHSGVPLNECADRIALQARRHLNGGTAPEVLDKVMARIVAEFRRAPADKISATQLPLAQTA